MQKKTIIIEAQRIFRRKKHGMDFVALELIRTLQKIDTLNRYIIAVGPGEDICLKETLNFKIEILPSSNYFFWEQFLLPRLIRKHEADLLHCTSNTAPIKLNVPLVLTLHDIIFMEKKMGNSASLYQKLGRIYRRMIVPAILKNVNTVITVSEFEKRNILNRYQFLKDKIHTVYNGVGKEFRFLGLNDSVDTKDIPKRSYWLFLANTDPKKNMKNTLLAYDDYLKKSQEKRKLLLLDTNVAFLDKLLAELGIENIKSHLIIKGYVSHHELPEWYNDAFASLYTSLRESFGLPLIEAMACETPVIGSNTTAIPEVAGDSIVYIDPTDFSSISEAMLLLEKNSALYTEKKRLGLIRSQLYSWEKTGNETLDIYKHVLA